MSATAQAAEAHAAVLDGADGLRHICPRCRTALALPPGRAATCTACGFTAPFDQGVYRFAAAAGEPGDWQDTYDKVATGALADTSSGLLYRSPVEHRLRTYRRLCGEMPAAARILDAGCANGAFAELLFGRPVVGVDFSFEMCVQACRRGLLAHQADALALPFADDQFDLVCAAGLLEHIEELPAVCAELARVCRPGGSVVLGTGNRLSLARRLMRLFRQIKPAPLSVMRRPVILRSPDELVAAAAAASLRLDLACWTYFPLPWQRCTRTAGGRPAPLASNFYARFVKPPRG